jgi:hypothetical protein
VVKDEQRDQQREIAVEAQQKQYETLKKTGKEVPISKKALEPQKKKSHYEMAQEFLSSIKGEDEKSAEYQKEKAQYEARYAEGVRTDFQDAQEEDLTKHPKVQAEYAKLKAEKAKEGDIQGDIASLRAVETQQKNEHMQALYEVQKKAPTKEGVAELVKKGLVGAQQLQKDMEMQEKINEEAKKKGELPKTLEEVMKERSLMAAKRWQAETLLKEGQNAVIDSAVKVEQSGSAADLAVLEANVKRLREGKPTLTGAEARETTKMADDKEKLSPLLGRDRMKAFRHGLTKASADATSEINATTTAVESTEQVTATMPYSGSDDELEPDSLNDPMFSKTVDSYGHSFSVEEDFDVDRQDDDAEMTALDDSDSYSTDAEDDAVQSAEDENELDQPEAELVSDATAGEHGAVDTYQEKLQSEAKLSKLSPSVVKLDDETENNDDDEAKLPDSADEAAEEPVSSGMEKPEVENEDEDEEVPENPTQAEDKDEDDESVPQ